MKASNSHETYASRRWDNGLFVAVLVFGLVIRWICACLLALRHFNYQDEEAYWTMAGQLLRGRGLSLPHSGFEGLIHANSPTAYFGTFALWIVPLRLIFNDHINIARAVIPAFSWPFLALLVNRYVRTWLPSMRSRIILLLLLSLHPDLIFLQSVVMSEALFIPLVIAILLLGNLAENSIGASAALGATYGFSLLIRPNLLLFLPIHLLIIFFAMPIGPSLRRATAAIIAALLVVMPWIIRNEIQFHRLMLESKSGFNLVLMNNEGDNASVWAEDFSHPILPRIDYGDEGQMDLRYRQVGIDYISHHPLHYLKLSVARFHNAFALTPTYMKLPRAVTVVFAVFNAAFYFVTIAGIAICARRHILFDCVALIVYAVVLQSLTNASFRHRSYIDAVMCTVGVVGLVKGLSPKLSPHLSTRQTLNQI